MIERVTFVTIGQTPRTDLVPEIVASLPRPVEVEEVGALDGVEPDDVSSLGPGPDVEALVTRLADGRQAVLGKPWVARRLQETLDGIGERRERDASHVTVLLCTGEFPGLRSRGLMLHAQHVVDGVADALCHGASSVGLLVPLERQERAHGERAEEAQAHGERLPQERAEEAQAHGERVPEERAEEGRRHQWEGPVPRRVRTAHASPYEDADFEAAGRGLAGCDLVVMHCMGYTEAQRDAVAAASGRPVLLARRLVAAALGQLL